jgi:hypothetical protein
MSAFVEPIVELKDCLEKQRYESDKLQGFRRICFHSVQLSLAKRGLQLPEDYGTCVGSESLDVLMELL